MKRIFLFTAGLILVSIILTGCRDNELIIDDVPDAAYVRIFTDFALGNGTSGSRYVYLNGDFDSTRAIVLRANSVNDMDQVNFGPMFGDPKNTFFNDSYYSFGSIARFGFSNYYPSYFDRIQVAPVIDQFDYYKWAKIKPGTLRLTITNRYIPKNTEAEGTIPGIVLDTTVTVNPGELSTLMLTRALDNSPQAFNSLLHVIEKPEQQNFDDKHSYIRFINVTAVTQELPDELDVYLNIVRINAPNPPIVMRFSNGITLVDDMFLGTVSGTFNIDAPFLELPQMSDTAFYRNNALRLDVELPRFTYKFFEKGKNPLAGDEPLFYISTLYGPQPFAYNTSYGPIDIADPTPNTGPGPRFGNIATYYPYTFDPRGNIHPTYATIVFGIRGNLNDRSLGLTRYLWEPANASDGYR